MMNLRIPGLSPTTPSNGSGPGGKVEIGDIRAKLQEIRGEVDDTVETAKPYGTMAAVAGVLIIVILAFLLGRNRGERKATWVEIRRL
jgi:hypothetical protein